MFKIEAGFFAGEEEQGEQERAAERERRAYSLVEKFLECRIDLGAGQAAQVFTMPEQGICIKHIVNGDREFSSNDVFEERGLMAQAREAGVRVARPVMAFACKEGNFIVMETIRGASMRDILEGKAALPESYDHDAFWDEAARMVLRLHSAGIYHRDLHEGNIMIEEATGKPVIIDFGLSCLAFGEDDDPYLVEDFPKPGETKVFRRDEDQVTQMRVRMLRYLQKRINKV